MFINTNVTSLNFESRIPKHSPELLQGEISKYLNMGKSVKEISQLINEKPQNVYRIIRLLGLNPPTKTKNSRIKEVNKILMSKFDSIISNSMTPKSIADQTGCTIKEVNQWFNENAIKIRKAQQLFMLKNGASCQKLAEEFGFTYTRACQVMREFIDKNMLTSEKPKKKELILKSIKLGLPVEDIAKKFKVSLSTVYKIRSTIDKEELEQPLKQMIIVLTKLGLNKTEIAKKMNISQQTLRKYIHRFNLLENVKNAKLQRKQQIYEEHQNGAEIKYLAKKYNISERNVSYIVKSFSQKD